MNLTFNHNSGILNEKGELVGIIEDTFDIEKIEIKGDNVIFEGTQVWDKRPELLPVGTVFKITFLHAKFEIPYWTDRSYKDINDTKELTTGTIFTPEGQEYELGYRHGITFWERHGEIVPAESDRWFLTYRDVEVEYVLPDTSLAKV